MSPETAAAILNVDVNASAEAVATAYKLKARMTHPDRFAGAPAKDIAIAQAEFIRVGLAREALLAHGRRPAPRPEPKPEPKPQPKPAPEPQTPPSQPRQPTTPPADEKPKTPPRASASTPPRQPAPPAPAAPHTPRKLSKQDRFFAIGFTAAAILIVAVGLYATGVTHSSPAPSVATSGPEFELSNSEWKGTDSEGVATEFWLDDDHTVDVILDSEEYDDPADTWTVDDSGWLEIHIDYEDGPATYSGRYVDYDTPIEMTVSGYEDGWTLTVR